MRSTFSTSGTRVRWRRRFHGSTLSHSLTRAQDEARASRAGFVVIQMAGMPFAPPEVPLEGDLLESSWPSEWSLSAAPSPDPEAYARLSAGPTRRHSYAAPSLRRNRRNRQISSRTDSSKRPLGGLHLPSRPNPYFCYHRDRLTSLPPLPAGSYPAVTYFLIPPASPRQYTRGIPVNHP